MGSMRKNLIGKNNLSIESSEVNVWLESGDTSEESFHFPAVCYVNSFFRFNLSNGFYSLDIYIYPNNLFRIEPLIVHSYLNDVVLI